MDFWQVAILVVIFLAAGMSKGVFGIGMPTFLIGCLTMMYAPRMAVAMILLSLIASNIRQAFRGGNPVLILRRHSVFCVFACVSMFLVAYFGGRVPDAPLMILVGIAMVLFAATSLVADVPALRPSWNIPAQGIAGVLSGVLGGLSAIWGPPLVIYLMSLKLEKNMLIQTMGVIFLAQSLFLTAGFVASGELTWAIAGVGAAMLVPTFTGLMLGERMREHLDTRQFMRGFLILFLVLGLNLIRRGIIA